MLTPIAEPLEEMLLALTAEEEASKPTRRQFLGKTRGRFSRVYCYQARDKEGRIHRGRVEGGNEKVLRQRLEQEGYEVISLGREDSTKPEPDETPAARIIDTILLYAIRDGVEEVQIEPQAESVCVSCRVGSTWHEWVRMPLYALHPVMDRLKVMGDMAIDERQHGQKGHIHVRLQDDEYDLHTVTTPTDRGETITLCIKSSS